MSNVVSGTIKSDFSGAVGAGLPARTAARALGVNVQSEQTHHTGEPAPAHLLGLNKAALWPPSHQPESRAPPAAADAWPLYEHAWVSPVHANKL